MPLAATLPLHPLALLLPELSTEEHRALTASIAEHGQLTPATSWVDEDGSEWLIDGRHRERACRELGIPLRVESLEGDESAARAFVLAANVMRRHLSPSLRAAAAAALATRGRGERGSAATFTQTEAAQAAGVSVRLVRAARTFAGDGQILRGQTFEEDRWAQLEGRRQLNEHVQRRVPLPDSIRATCETSISARPLNTRRLIPNSFRRDLNT